MYQNLRAEKPVLGGLEIALFPKFLVFLSLFFLFSNAFGIVVETFPENQTDPGNCAIIKGQLVAEMTNKNDRLLREFDQKMESVQINIENYVEKRTNPIFLAIPNIIVLIIISLLYLILKSKGNV